MQRADLQQALNGDLTNPDALFDALRVVSRYALEYGPTEKFALDAIIRLRDLVDRAPLENQAFKDAVFSLCREAGLFPYMPEQELIWRDQLALEFFRGPLQLDYVFHREQWQAFRLLLSGKSVVLSAPTSFGKSILIHAFIGQLYT